MFNSCQDIFTTSFLSGLAADPSSLSGDALTEYTDALLSDPNATSAELEIVEDKLVDSRIEPTAENMANQALKDQYVAETKQLLDLNFKQADVEGILTSLISDDSDSENDSSNESFLTDILDDSDRLDNLEEAAGFAVDAYKVDPESLSSTQLVVGSAGLVSDIISDDTKADALESATDLETDTLESAGFTSTEIENIQMANDMLDLAKSDMTDDMASMLEGLPF